MMLSADCKIAPEIFFDHSEEFLTLQSGTSCGIPDCITADSYSKVFTIFSAICLARLPDIAS